MKKQHFKRYLMVLGLSLLFVSCVQDDAFNTEVEPVSDAPRFTLQKITSPNLMANPKLYKTIGELSYSVGFADNGLTLAKNVYNAEQDFIVDTSIANYIEYGDYHSYTFPVIRPTDNGLTENLLLSLQADGSYKAFLFTYDLTDAEKTLLQNNVLVDLEGKVSMQVLDDQWANTVLAKTEYELGNGVCVDIREEYEMCCSNTHSSQDVREGQTCNCEQQPTATYLTVTVGPCSNGGGGGGRGNTDVNTDGPIPNTYGNVGLLGGNVGGGQNANPNGNINSPGGNDTNNPNNTQEENSDCLQANSNGDCVNNVTAVLIKDDEDEDDCDTSKEDLKKIFPNIPDDNAKLLASVINDKGKDFGIDSDEDLWHFLSQAGHETGGFNTLNVTESTYWTTASKLAKTYKKFTMDSTAASTNANLYYAPDYLQNSSGVANVAMCCRYGNGDVDSGDGYKYRGRGIFQLTWKDNYQSFKTWYNNKYDPDIDPVTTPGIIASNDTLAILSGLWYYKTRVVDKITIDSTTTVKKVTKPINSAKKGLADRKARFKKAKDSINCI